MALPSFDLTADPSWPWSLPAVGPGLLAAVAVGLTALTVWTYRGTSVSRRRVALAVGLLLAALALALAAVVRPTLAVYAGGRDPSTLLVALDASESMNVKDEADGQSRWATLQRTLQQCQPLFDRLREERAVSVRLYRFADDVSEYNPDGKADGSRTDFGRMLHGLAERHAQEPSLRALIVLSDGADNGTQFPALGEAAAWRARGCPIQTFALGQAVDPSVRRDVALTNLVPEPSPVAVKGKLVVRATFDAPGYETAEVECRVLLDDKEAKVEPVRMRKAEGNEALIELEAPATPGEYKLTVRAKPLPGEASTVNNEASTFLTVTKEGIKVLVVDRLRTELAFLRRALVGDSRIRLVEAVRQTDDPAAGEDAFQFQKQAYDVIVLGDVTAQRLRAADPKALTTIESLVREKGVGFLMTGGTDAFGSGDWKGTPIEALLPVELSPSGQVDEPVRFEPTPAGLRDSVLRLAPNADDTAAAWKRLPALDGFTRLGRPKPGSVVLAVSQLREPLLVRQDFGKGRTAALAVDTTWEWTRLGLPKTTEGLDLHARFWKQLMLYLAHQEEQAGTVWVRPDARRIAAGGKLGFVAGLRGKTGLDLAGAFEATLTAPGAEAEPVGLAKERDGDRGTVWKTDTPGEYKLTVRGKGKDADGSEVSGEATARFLVYRDDTELLRQAADHDFLTKLATAGGGKFHRAEDLAKFLKEMADRPATDGKAKPTYYPDWKRRETGALRPLVLLAFVGLLGIEWGLRRYWGLV